MLIYSIGFVLYNPTSSSIDRINMLISIGFNVYVFDNSPIEEKVLSKIDCRNFYYYFANENMGLAYSIDFLCDLAFKKENKYLLFFDQDTIFNLESLNYINSIINLENSLKLKFDKNIASINFRDIKIENQRFNVVNTELINGFKFHQIYFGINSGTLYFLENYKKYKWFDKSYFVDGVDYYFSINSIINGYINLSVGGIPGINHSVEQGDNIFYFWVKEY